MRFWLACGLLGLFGFPGGGGPGKTGAGPRTPSSSRSSGPISIGPSGMSRCRRPDWGTMRFDDRLDDLSAEARSGYLERDRRTLAELPTRVDRDRLSRDGRIDFDIFRHHLVR